MDHILKKLEHESLREAYFLTVALILAFGMIQTTGTALQTDKPVVSVVSCSMYPSLGVGDVIIVQGQDYEDINQGDVLVFGVKEATVTVNNQEYFVKNYNGGETVETPAGDIGISQIIQDTSGQAAGAVLTVNGEEITMRENEAVQINGNTLTLNEATGMNIPIVHRVIEKNDDTLATKGDNNNNQLEFEKEIKPEQVKGTMMFKIPKVGGLKLLVMDIVGFQGDKPLVLDTYPSCSA